MHILQSNTWSPAAWLPDAPTSREQDLPTGRATSSVPPRLLPCRMRLRSLWFPSLLFLLRVPQASSVIVPDFLYASTLAVLSLLCTSLCCLAGTRCPFPITSPPPKWQAWSCWMPWRCCSNMFDCYCDVRMAMVDIQKAFWAITLFWTNRWRGRGGDEMGGIWEFGNDMNVNSKKKGYLRDTFQWKKAFNLLLRHI